MNEEHINISKEDYLKTLEILHEKGSDGFGEFSSYLISALGGAGTCAAATLLGAITATPTILGSTTLASWLGVTGTIAAISNPVGWAIGGVTAIGALTAFGLSRICLKSGRENAKRDSYKENLHKKIIDYMTVTQNIDYSDNIKRIADTLIIACHQGKISEEDGSKLIMLLKDKKITPEVAFSTLLKISDGK